MLTSLIIQILRGRSDVTSRCLYNMLIGGWIYVLMPYFWGHVSEAAAIQTGCDWRSSISPTMSWIQEARPWSWCSDGQLHWCYPKGMLQAHFKQDVYETGDFRVCLEMGQWAQEITNVLDQTTLPHTNVNIPTGSSEVCVTSSDGEVVIQFEAANGSRDVTQIKYFIKQPWHIHQSITHSIPP